MEKKDIRIVYMGTPKMAAALLESLLDDGYNVVAIVTQEDKEIGRKKVVTPSPVKIVGQNRGIRVFSPHRLKADHDFLFAFDFDFLLTFAYGQIIPQAVLDIPSLGVLNIHGSELPRYRGAAPIQRAIMNGDEYVGVDLMQTVFKMDAGKVYASKRIYLSDEDNYSTVSMKAAVIGKELLDENLLPIAQGDLQGREQDESQATIIGKIKPEEEEIPLTKGVKEFVNHVRALSEEPGAFIRLNGKKLKIYRAEVFSSETRASLARFVPDKKKLLLQLKDGIVSLMDVQLEGKKRMDAASFLNGNRALIEGHDGH